MHQQSSLVKDYAKTLDEWDRKFIDVEPELIKLGFDKRQRMWCLFKFMQRGICAWPYRCCPTGDNTCLESY